MEPLTAGSTGVDVEEVELVVVHDLEDMAMATDEDVGVVVAENVENSGRVMPRPTTYVGKKYLKSIAGEEVGGRHRVAKGVVVDVAIDGMKGLESAQPLIHPTPQVAGMP